MAFYFLNKLDKSITKKELEKKFREFGKLKFIGNIQDDKRDNNFNSTIAVFNQLDSEDKLLEYCKSKKIFLQLKNDNKVKIQKEAPTIRTTQKSVTKIHNPSFYFYKDEAYGKDIESFRLEENYETLFKIDGAKSFELTTTYPGLLVGSGYNHPKLKENDDDFQLGFFFDHTTGLPIISGSSIKGLIRSVFPQKDDKYYEEKIRFLKQEYSYTFDEKSIEDFFDNNAEVIFYDAYIASTDNTSKAIFGSDYITSHYSDEENGELKSPNPIKFLKILPSVTFNFQYKCSNQELEFFKSIILDFGLGAKTNTGYGKFKA